MIDTLENKPLKKNWIKPEFQILSRESVESKSHPSVHEATGHPANFYGNPAFLNVKGAGFSGTKYQAIS